MVITVLIFGILVVCIVAYLLWHYDKKDAQERAEREAAENCGEAIDIEQGFGQRQSIQLDPTSAPVPEVRVEGVAWTREGEPRGGDASTERPGGSVSRPSVEQVAAGTVTTTAPAGVSRNGTETSTPAYTRNLEGSQTPVTESEEERDWRDLKRRLQGEEEAETVVCEPGPPPSQGSPPPPPTKAYQK